MKRKTSLEAFEYIKSNGLLTKREFQVYEILFEHGPLTAHEIVSIARKKYNLPDANQTGWNSRTGIMEKAGVIENVGEKAHPTSGRLNILWDVTDKKPLPREKKNPLDVLRVKILKQKVKVTKESRKLNQLIGEWKNKPSRTMKTCRSIFKAALWTF